MYFKKTIIIIFCSTLYKDKNWIAIRKWVEKRGNPHEFFTSIHQDGEDQIQRLVDELNDEARAREEEQNDKEEEHPVSNIDRLMNYFKNHGHGDKKEKKKKKPKDKYQSLEYFIVFDDIGNELKSPSLLALLRQNRHYLSKIVISSQYLNHLLPESRKQLDLFIIFKGQPEKKLQEIYRDADLAIPFEKFLSMYKEATKINKDKKKKQFPFFYVDTRNDDFRRYFNQRFIDDQEEKE